MRRTLSRSWLGLFILLLSSSFLEACTKEYTANLSVVFHLPNDNRYRNLSIECSAYSKSFEVVPQSTVYIYKSDDRNVSSIKNIKVEDVFRDLAGPEENLSISVKYYWRGKNYTRTWDYSDRADKDNVFNPDNWIMLPSPPIGSHPNYRYVYDMLMVDQLVVNTTQRVGSCNVTF